MTASAGIRTHGTKIAIGDGASPEVFTNLGEATSIGEFGESRGTIDFSNHRNNYERYGAIAGRVAR